MNSTLVLSMCWRTTLPNSLSSGNWKEAVVWGNYLINSYKRPSRFKMYRSGSVSWKPWYFRATQFFDVRLTKNNEYIKKRGMCFHVSSFHFSASKTASKQVYLPRSVLRKQQYSRGIVFYVRLTKSNGQMKTRRPCFHVCGFFGQSRYGRRKLSTSENSRTSFPPVSTIPFQTFEDTGNLV